MERTTANRRPRRWRQRQSHPRTRKRPKKRPLRRTRRFWRRKRRSMARDILIIDDEDDIRDLIAGILEDEGYEARQAHDADSSLNEIARRRPSLVFLDIW